MLEEFSPGLIQRQLTSLFPGEFIEDIVREHDVVQRHHRIDVIALVWTLILGFAVGDESHTIVGFQRVHATAINQVLSHSDFYDRSTPAFGWLLSDLLESMLEEVAVPHALVPQLQQSRDAMTADATVSQLHRLPNEFPATHPDQSGTKLHFVHSLTKQTTERFEFTDERSHESSQFRTRDWLRGRSLLFDLGFCSYRRFASIKENDGFFLNRLRMNTNSRTIKARRKWHGHAISLPDRYFQDVLGSLTREVIDVAAKMSFKRHPYGEKRLSTTMEFRVVDIHNRDTDDYHLYTTNFLNELTPE